MLTLTFLVKTRIKLYVLWLLLGMGREGPGGGF